MKLRTIKPQSAPVPTDNPKPKSGKLAAKPTKRLRVKTEPAPQPVVGKIRIRKTVRFGTKVVEPLPQPVLPKVNIATSSLKLNRSQKRAIKTEEATAAPIPVIQSAAAHEEVGVSPTIQSVEKGTSSSRAVVEKSKLGRSRKQGNAVASEEMVSAPVVVIQSAATHEEAAIFPTIQATVAVQEKPSVRSVRQPRPVPVAIPRILLEPDHLPGDEPVLTGPGVRFLATPSLEPVPVAFSPTELPESYGTQQIFLAARDPYWLLASWDLDEGQRQRYNGQSASGALTVRLRKGDAEGPIHLEVHVKADSRDWFIYAGAPDTTFVAELGFHEKNSGIWRRISISKTVTTPRDRVSAPPAIAHVEAPQIPQEARLDSELHQEPAPSPAPPPPTEEVFFAIFEFAPAQPALAAIEHRWEPPAVNTPPRNEPTPAWTESQSKALDELISLELKKSQQGSIEIEDLLRRHIGRPEQETAPSSLELIRVEELLGLVKPEAPSSLELAGMPAKQKNFWFKVNAELIIYGSTEPDAHVTIGGRTIRLREDGTFSYRFALPDGDYGLPVLAIAHDYSEARGADLRCARATQYLGEVGAHAQDSALKTPAAANV